MACCYCTVKTQNSTPDHIRFWWPKITKKTAQNQLNTVQRYACLGITGVMKTCPTAAMEVMLDLTPLYLLGKREAIKGALKLLQLKHFKEGDLASHPQGMYSQFYKKVCAVIYKQ